MKCFISAVCVFSVFLALADAAPMPQNDQASGTDTRVQTTQIVEGINSKIRLLRQYCPQIFQVIDNVIQNVTSTAFRVIGRAVLQSGGLGGGSGGDSMRRVTVVLPTFSPEDEDYEDEDEEDTAGSTTTTTTTTTTTEASTTTSASTPSETSEDPDIDIRVDDSRAKPQTLSSENEIEGESTEIAPFTSPASDSSDRAKREVRVVRAAAEGDQEVAASGGNGPSPAEDLANVDAEDADRDKRFLPFGGSFGGHAGGSAGGSGNFLFDIIRRTADGAARAAGTVYRMVAGTENSGLALTATSTSTRTLSPQLVAGSGATEESDEKDNAPVGAGGVAEIDLAKGGDGYTEGVPGPITRLFVLANRGLANLVQDLILRLAQTSERIVNFKARLVTALI